MAKYKVTYTYEQAAPLTYDFVVEADSEDEAKMRAGMARAESFVQRFAADFWWPNPIRWERLKVEKLDE
jgi:hypothetical protein